MHMIGTLVRFSRMTPTGILQLSSGQWDDAARTFETVLVEKPTNVVALLGKVGPYSVSHLQLGSQHSPSG